MDNKQTLAFDWLKRYTGTNPDEYGDWILLTNFQNYVETLLLLHKSIYLFDQKIFYTANYTKSPNNVGVSFINKKAPVRRLFEPEAFHFSNTIFLVLTKSSIRKYPL